MLDALAARPPTRRRRRAVIRRQPLAGVRIVDFTWAIAGSFATRLLADLGADVVKLESEHRLDPIRHIGPQPTAVVSLDTNGVFQDAGAGKRAVTLNVDTPEGQELARRLIATADVVTANYTPDRLDRWGFDRDTLQSLRPGLIVANLAVMGLSGPDAGWRSYGNGLVAMSGIAAHTGFEGRVPQCLGTMHTDFTVPYFAAHADPRRPAPPRPHRRGRLPRAVAVRVVGAPDGRRAGRRPERRRRRPAASPTARRGASRTASSRPPATTAGSPSPVATTTSGPRWPAVHRRRADGRRGGGVDERSGRARRSSPSCAAPACR